MSIITVAEDVLAKLEADGVQIERWLVTEFDKLVPWLKQQDGFVGTVAKVIDEMDAQGGSGFDKLARAIPIVVPEVIKLLTAGKSAFAVVETEMFGLAQQAITSVYNDRKASPVLSGVITALGLD